MDVKFIQDSFCGETSIHRKEAKELVHSGVHDWNHIWTKKMKNTLTEVTTMMVKLDTMIKEAIVHEYKHENSRNDWWMMRLKAIEVDYYYIEI